MEMKSTMEKSASTVQHLMERVGSLESRTNAIERLQDAIEQRVELLDERRERHLERYESKIETLEEQATRTSSTITQLTRRVDDLHLTSGAGGPGINYSTVSSGYGTDVQPATSSHLLGLSGPVGGGASPQRVDALQGRVVEVEHGVDRALSSCLDQELRIQLLERATYNGVLIWKIDEFERRCKEAIDGVTMSLYSTPFYTSRHGYKMCCRIYLNGDGLGKGTHLSFFFVIMRGPFDALLEWPFKQKVTMTLLNQSERRSVTDSFRPDAQSSSFLRPLRREMNIASGCPMFIKLSHLMSGGFVKDDCIYVRAVVDTADLPKYP